MTADGTSFGRFISESRKKLKMSQKELAANICREDGVAISPQYLNDIERDRRNPSSDSIVQQFATALGVNADYLYYLTGRIPEDIRRADLPEERVVASMRAFRGKPSKA